MLKDHVTPSNELIETRCDAWQGQLLEKVPKRLPRCRGIVKADVLKLGLNRGAIAARKLEGVKREKEHEGLYWFGPLR